MKSAKRARSVGFNYRQELMDALNGDMFLATRLDAASPRTESMSSKIERWTVDTQSSCTLFKLPPELRLDIYDLALAEHDTYLDRYGERLLPVSTQPQWLLHELPEDTEGPLPEHSSLKELDNIFYMVDGLVASTTREHGLGGGGTSWLSPSVTPRRFQHTELLCTCRRIFIEARDTLMKNATLRAFDNCYGGRNWLQWPVTELRTPLYSGRYIPGFKNVTRSWFHAVTRQNAWRCIKDLHMTFSTKDLTADWKKNARCRPHVFIRMPSLNRVTFHFEGVAERFHVLRELAEMAQSQWKFRLSGKMKGHCLRAQGSIKVHSWRGLCDSDDSHRTAYKPHGTWSTVNAPVGTIGGMSHAEYMDAFAGFERRHRSKSSDSSLNHSMWDLDDLRHNPGNTPFDEHMKLCHLGLGQVMYKFSVTFTAWKNRAEDEGDDSKIPGPGEVKEGWPEILRDVLVSSDGPDVSRAWGGPYLVNEQGGTEIVRWISRRTWSP
ncbi:hypothetical protein FGRMN_4716 [Fusarium graminum]|nr:hypothetical protein FGRMN_4716 [Fusarium graminum]